MLTATFWLVLLAALPCAAGNKKSSGDLYRSLRQGGPNFQTAAFSMVRADAAPHSLSVIWGASMVWANAFTGADRRASILGEN